MAAEQILKLFDSCWFEHEIFSNNNKLCISSSPPTITKPIQHDQQQQQQHHKLQKPKLSGIAILRVRALSDRCLRFNTGLSPDVASPNSVITTPRLEKILFGKQTSDHFSQRVEEQVNIKKKVSNRRRRMRRSKGISKSLSDLESEELKGFMDLGFVFTEEDKTSNLVSIIPGLQRWGRKASDDDDDDDEPISENYTVSRPYLSEAWGVLNQRKFNKPLVNWRFPDKCNEINMKDQLKAWAHTVASSFR